VVQDGLAGLLTMRATSFILTAVRFVFILSLSKGSEATLALRGYSPFDKLRGFRTSG
jgi:hypothetical protein